MTDSQPLSVTITREYDAPIDLVFAAWTDADKVSRWMKCDDSAVLECSNWQPATGAEFTTTMEMPGQWKVQTTGRFTTVEPPHLLAYVSDENSAMQMPQMTVRVELEDLGNERTRLTLTHTGMPNDDICGVIQGGWSNSLTALEAIVAVEI
ncbi:MAG: SRPBCC domain-containing protein [bacterium]|nr:SRPBCC domain-containing protein [bacterium]